MTQLLQMETFEERLKRWLVPGWLYIRYRTWKERRKGEPEIRHLTAVVPAGRVSLDIGANKGVYAHVLSGLSREVHAFEPNPKLFRILKSGAARNVICHPVALSDKAGEADLIIPRFGKRYTNQGASLSNFKGFKDFATVTVPVETVDGLGLENVGFMKVDVEGLELNVLKGARKTLKRDRPVLLVEMEERHTGRPIEEMIEEVMGYGYRCAFLKNDRFTEIEVFDAERDHRGRYGKPGYIFNFFFLPE